MDITVAITTYNEGEYLDRLLDDISRQYLGTLEIEVVLLEAGSYDCLRAQKYLRDLDLTPSTFNQISPENEFFKDDWVERTARGWRKSII